MKHFDEAPHEEKMEIKAEVRKEFRFLAREPIKKGHTLFELNSDTGEIVPAIIQEQKTYVNLHGATIAGNKKVYKKPGCIYFWALNLKNAYKKVKKAQDEYLKQYERGAISGPPEEGNDSLPETDAKSSGEATEESGSSGMDSGKSDQTNE